MAAGRARPARERKEPKPKKPNRYARLLEHIFAGEYSEGDTRVEFERPDIVGAAEALDIKLPKNLGDVVYSHRYRNEMPEGISAKAPPGTVWIIRPNGRARYAFCAIDEALANIRPNPALVQTKVPDSTPGIIARYAKTDEQALLARLRYNRLVDIFTGVACYSLQSHYRTTVTDMGQVETDELYVGLDKQGVHYVFPVQAKGGRDRISIVQIEQDIALCREKFPEAVCRPIAAQFMAEGQVIALFEFQDADDAVRIRSERHYRLVPQDRLTAEEIAGYRAAARPDG